MNNNTIIELGNNYSVEVIKTIPDADGADLEGFLYFDKKMLDNITTYTKYKTIEELVIDFKTNILPKYIRENKVQSIKGLITSKDINIFVKKYLAVANLTWGTSIDTLEVLVNDGYIIPKAEDQCFNIIEYQEYLLTVTKISLEITNQLKTLGFGADRNTSNVNDHIVIDKHPLCMNIVYTRYPWTAGYKMYKTVKQFEATVNSRHIGSMDMEEFKKKDKEGYNHLIKLSSSLAAAGLKISDIFSEDFNPNMATFSQYIDENIVRLVKKYSKLRPDRYNEFMKEYKLNTTN